MGRLSKTFHEMQKKQHSSYLEEASVQQRLKICQQLLDSILKSRSGARKTKYKEELRNVHEFLSVKAQDHEELKKASYVQKQISAIKAKIPKVRVEKQMKNLEAELGSYWKPLSGRRRRKRVNYKE